MIYMLFVGIGAGLLYGPGYVIVGYYFEKRKGLANAVTSSGIGAGVFTIPPLFNYWMHSYGYLGTMVSFFSPEPLSLGQTVYLVLN